MIENIDDVIKRCEMRIDLALDCNIDDIRRLIDEIRRQKAQTASPSLPMWHGLGTGD